MRGERKMAYVIGFDFGNMNSFPCFISDIDLNQGRMGGNMHDLLPANKSCGIPSVFFYSNKVRMTADTKPLPWCGDDAVRTAAKPLQNRKNLLKRHLGQKLVLDDREFTYDEAIVQVIQYCIRSANKILKEGWLEETNLISISYPATYTSAQRERLVELVEMATLEDGRHLKVFGTIAEPAAAALDYLAEYAKSSKETTVLTYDLGGGTFDLSLVTAYPEGRLNANGNRYYYDIINSRGIPNLGGHEFDEGLFKLAKEKIGKELTPGLNNVIYSQVEEAKIELTNNEETVLSYYDIEMGEYVDIPVTRKEFEDKTKDLVQKTVEKTREMLNDHRNQRPEVILLTGGASQMPMIQEAIKAAFPEYKDKIIYFRPSKAIAYGAARFGAVEENADPSDADEKENSPIIQRTMYDLGVRIYHNVDDKEGYIETLISEGTEVPCLAPEKKLYTLVADQSKLRFEIYEAKNNHPDVNQIREDYTYIMEVTLDLKRKCKPGTPAVVRMGVNKKGILTFGAYDPENPRNKIDNTAELKNLS